MFEAIDHIGIAVQDLESSVEAYSSQFGVSVEHRETVEAQGVEAVLLGVGSSHIELLAPLGPDTPVGKYLAKRGPGIHHIAYRVADIESEIERLKEAGVRLIDEKPRPGICDTKVAFIHPSSAGGVLTELVQPPETD